MPGAATDSQTAVIPAEDGQVTTYINQEAAAQTAWFSPNRRVIFINGMKNSGQDHAASALALSLMQMCPVVGVYNRSSGVFRDLMQAFGDKDQFNGPTSLSASNRVAVGRIFRQATSEQIILNALGRNPAQVSLFRLMRRPEHRSAEVFAHSQGCLILSNVLQAIAAVDGKSGIQGRVVHTFGSPAVRWPKGIRQLEHGFTFDPVNWLSGIDFSMNISKVGLAAGSFNPVSHGFLTYLENDPAFVVNRCRIGGLGVTFRMNEPALAECLLDMGSNLPRVRRIFEYLDAKHNSDADDVAELYIEGLKKNPSLAKTVAGDRELVRVLKKVLSEGWTTESEKKAIAWLDSL
ncbi:MAG: hypothetical protein R3C19_19050 [Planctomycetaceae bacterium]